MVTIQQAQTAQNFHEGECVRRVGERGGVTTMIRNWRRGGKTKFWKTRPTEFQIPIKYGLYASGYINELNAKDFHVSTECPLLTEGV